MSKSIIVPLNNLRSHLHDLFDEFMEYSHATRRSNVYDCSSYGYYDDEEEMAYLNALYGYDDELPLGYDMIFPNSRGRQGRNSSNTRSRTGKKRHSKKSRARVVDIHTPIEGFIGDDTELFDIEEKHIRYYFWYKDRYNYSDFKSLREFSDFCEVEGIKVSERISNELAYRYESHCCLDPTAKDNGELVLVIGRSYSDMLYEAVPCEELSQ